MTVFDAKSNFARARITRVLSSGPERIDPPCPHHHAPSRQGPFCGGCDWQHLAYESQLKHKRDIVIDCVGRIGKFADADKLVLPTMRAPKPWGYRNKVQIPFMAGPHGPRMGFFSAGSREIVDMRECPIQPDLSVRIAFKIKALAIERGWTYYDGKTGRGWLRHLYIRTNAEGRALVGLVTTHQEFSDRESSRPSCAPISPRSSASIRTSSPSAPRSSSAPSGAACGASARLEETLGRFHFSASPAPSSRSTRRSAEVLYNAAKDAVKEGGKKFPLGLDLYCGVGTLTLWLADVFPRILGVEENKDAVSDAYANAERNRVRNARFKAGRAESVLPKLARELPADTCVVVDPPRVGLSQPVRRFLTDKKIKRLVYVSCDPATFARDAGFLSHSGYRLRRVQPVDLFAQTSHVELVGLMDRK